MLVTGTPAPAPPPSQLRQWLNRSETVAWGYLQIAAGTLTSLLNFIGFLATDPDVKSAIGAFNLPPRYGLVLACMGAISLFAHGWGKDHDR